MRVASCIFVLFVSMWCACPAFAQRPDYSALLAEMDRSGTATQADTGVSITRADFKMGTASIEAIAFKPAGDGPFPGLLLIPGYMMTARDWAGNGLAFAKAGYFCIAVTQPGFGGSDGPADFCGPGTIAALTAAWQKLGGAGVVDHGRLGIVGYSRGAMAAALLATQLDNAKAVVLGAGVYDFQKAYDEAAPGIRANMEAETGMTPEAVDARSAVRHLEPLSASVLILHGDQDANAPVDQAYLLRDKLTQLSKDFEIQVFTGAEHSIGIENFRKSTLEFLGRKLAKADNQ